MDKTTEKWKPVIGYEQLYEVSNQGNVKRLSRTCIDKNGTIRKLKQKLLSPSINSKGYRTVTLTKNGKSFTRNVSHLVAEAFIGVRPEGFVVAHGIHGCLCDSLDNLSYKTYSQNMGEDRVRDGTDTRGEKNSNSRLTKEQVCFARKAVRREHATYALLAKAWGVDKTTLRRAVIGSSWTWLN